MDIATARHILTQKEPARLYDVVQPALDSAALRDLLVEGSVEKNETVRYNCVRVLFRALEREPRLFYRYWDQFASMVGSVNGFHRSAGAQAIAHLTVVDSDCRLDRIFRQYLRLLDDDKVMVSHYFIETLDRIYRARPDLQRKVLTTLLSIDKTRHPEPRKELLKADILAVFDRLFDVLPTLERKKAAAFAERCLESKSGKTRKAARTFLAQHAA